MQAIKHKTSLLKYAVSSTKLPLFRQLALTQRTFAFKVSVPLNQEFQQTASKAVLNEYQQVPGQPRPKKTQIAHMAKGALPLDRQGIVALPKLPTRQFVSEYLGH